jgi:Zn finger protein HypA/HybF involved in hydrogenase expression
MPSKKQGKCKRCKQPMDLEVEWQKYCSPKCRAASYYARRAEEARMYRKMMEKRESA